MLTMFQACDIMTDKEIQLSSRNLWIVAPTMYRDCKTHPNVTIIVQITVKNTTRIQKEKTFPRESHKQKKFRNPVVLEPIYLNQDGSRQGMPEREH